MTSPAVELQFKGSSRDLGAEMDKVSSSTRRMSDDIEGSTSRIASASERSSGRTKAAFGAMATGVAGFVGGMVASTGPDLLNMGKNLQALDVKAKTVFQDQLPRIQKWADANRKAFGESSRNVVAMAANMTDLLKPMGFTTQQASAMATETLDLAGALSRWSGGAQSAAEVADILSAAFLGERDALQSLGISISQAEVDAALAAKGQEKLTGAARQQAEALATQQLVLEKSTDAQKAWADGGKAAAEQQNAASSNAKESFEKLAIAIQPVVEWLTKFITAIMDWSANHQTAVIAFGALTIAVWALNSAMLANPWTWIILGIVAIVAGVIWLWENVDGFRNFFIVAWDLIQQKVSQAVDRIKGIWNGMVSAFNAVKDAIGVAIDWIQGGFGRLVNFFIGFKNTVVGIFNGIGSAISGAFRTGVNAIVSILNGAISGINLLIRGYNAIPFAPDIPQIPKIPKMHSGGIVPGPPGSEHLRILQAGEEVIPANQRGRGGGSVVLGLRDGSEQGAADFVSHMFRIGAVQLVTSSGERVQVA